MEKLQVEYIPIDEIIPYEKNPRKNDKAIDVVAKSIKEFGFNVPILLDKENIIIAGHTRLKAAQKLSLQEIPVIWVESLTPEQVKAFRIMDNKSTEYSGWMWKQLTEELKDLQIRKYDLSMTGFTESEINSLFGVSDEYLKEGEPKYDVKIGDIYQMGEHRIICGDSTHETNYSKLLEGKKIKLTITSPPYNMNSSLYSITGGMLYKDNLESCEYIDLNLKVIKEIEKNLDGYIFWNLSYNMNSRWEFIEIFYRIIHETKLKFLENIIWDKGHGLPISSDKMLTRTYEQILVVGTEDTIQKELSYTFVGCNIDKVYMRKRGNKGLTNYWRINTINSQSEVNKATFPIELPLKAIILMSDKGDIICDPFVGTGTTLIACEKSERKFVGIELNPYYCSHIIQRWENLTGKKAVKLNNGTN